MNGFTWNPDECDSRIYDGGVTVCWLSAGKAAIQDFVKTLSEKAGVKCDWHYAAGIAYVKTMPEDAGAVRAVVADDGWMNRFLVPYTDETSLKKTYFTQYGRVPA